IIPTTIFRGLAGGAIIVVLISVGASMTLLPAVIALLGDKLNAGRIFHRRSAQPSLPGKPGGFWDKQTRRVMNHPVWFLVGGAVFMLVLSTPYFFQSDPGGGTGIKLGFSGVTTLPDNIQTKQAFNALVAHFPKLGSD